MSIFGKNDRGDAEVDRPAPAIAGNAASQQRPAPANTAGAPRATASGATDMSVVSRGLTIEGNLTGDDDIRVDGTVNGDITSRSVVVSQGATVDGSVSAETIEVLGHVSGEIAGKSVRISGTGQLDGDITYEALSIESGAVVNGQLRHGARNATNAAKSGNGLAKGTPGKAENKTDAKAESKAEAKSSDG